MSCFLPTPSAPSLCLPFPFPASSNSVPRLHSPTPFPVSASVSLRPRPRTPSHMVGFPRSSGGLACALASSVVTVTSCAAAASRSDFEFVLLESAFVIASPLSSVLAYPPLSFFSLLYYPARLRPSLPQIPNCVVCLNRLTATPSPLSSLRYSLSAIRCPTPLSPARHAPLM